MIPFPSSPFSPARPGSCILPALTATQLSHYLLTTFPGVETEETYDGRRFFAGPHHRMPFLILTETEQSLLDPAEESGVDSILQVSIGVSCETFAALVEDGAKVTSLTNSFVPDLHPERKHFVSIANPEESSMAALKAYITEAYRLAARRGATEMVSAA